jgi:tripartite-type tricarboxylate transporter receptor subunit TctC
MKLENALSARTLLGAAISFFALTPGLARADAVSDFYRGKTINFIVGAAAGGGFDLTARPLAPFLSKYIPGHPNIVIQNMPGAAGIIMTNYLANGAASDGTMIGMGQNGVPYEPILRTVSPDGRNVNYDPRKLQWIGTPVREPQVSWVSDKSGVKTWQDLKTKTVRFGATSPAGDNAVFPALANELLGLKSAIITGYQGVPEIFQAIESGELDANNTAYSNLTMSKADALRNGTVRIIMQFGVERVPSLKDVPTLLELVNNPDDERMLRFISLKFEMSRPIYAPPGIPADRLEALRTAFDKAVADPEFLALANRAGLEIDPLDGKSITKIVDEVMDTPQPVIDRTRDTLRALGAK